MRKKLIGISSILIFCMAGIGQSMEQEPKLPEDLQTSMASGIGLPSKITIEMLKEVFIPNPGYLYNSSKFGGEFNFRGMTCAVDEKDKDTLFNPHRPCEGFRRGYVDLDFVRGQKSEIGGQLMYVGYYKYQTTAGQIFGYKASNSR